MPRGVLDPIHAYVYGTRLALIFFKPRHGVLKPMKLPIQLKAAGLLLAFVVSSSSFANECSKHLRDITKGIATKGYLYSIPLDDPRGYDLAKQGLIGWGLSAFIKPSVEAAKAHFDLKEAEENLAKLKVEQENNKDPKKAEALKLAVEKGEEFLKTDINKDPLTKGMYLIADVPENFASMPEEERKQVYKDLFPKVKVVYFHHETGAPIEITEEEKSVFDLSKLRTLHLGVAGVWFSNPGWVLPKIRGVLKMDKATIGGNTYKNLKGQARKYEGKGYTYHFNYNFEKSLQMLRDQKRVGQDVEENRFRQPAVFNAAIQSYKNGKAFSVEMVDRHGNIKGGFVCFRYGNIISINSVFYDPPNEEDVNLEGKTEEEKKEILETPLLDFAKVPVLALMDRLQAAGIEFIDMGMVSPYSHKLKTRYISQAEFLGMVNKLPQEELAIDVTGAWKAPLGGPAKK